MCAEIKFFLKKFWWFEKKFVPLHPLTRDTPLGAQKKRVL